MYQLEASKKNPKSSQSLQGRATNRFFVLSLDLPYHLVSRAFDLATPSISATTTINPTLACSLENFSGQLKHSPSRRLWAISSGDRRLKRPSVGEGALGGAVAELAIVALGVDVERDEAARGR